VPPEALRARIDRCLVEDAGLVGLLYLRAHLSALDGDAATARADLELVSSLGRGLTDREGHPSLHPDQLYRLWVLARLDKDAAAKLAAEVERSPVFTAKPAARVMRWLKEDPHLAPVRGEPAFKQLLAEFAPR
jgi:hypothetical protein